MNHVRILTLLCAFSYNVNAAEHTVGAHLSYQWYSGNQYLLTLTYYRDCALSNAPDSAAICINSISNNVNFTTYLPLSGGPVQLPPFPYWPPTISTCNGGTSFGVEKYVYTKMISIPIISDDWIISFTGLKTLTPPLQNSSICVFTKIDNLNYPQNSSINFQNDPIFNYCLLQPSWEAYLATDNDSDIIHYSIEFALLDSIKCPAQTFTSPLYPYYPIHSSIPYFIDSIDGWMYFIPDILQLGLISIKAKEIRNGVVINETIYTHYQYAVVNCIITDLLEIKPDYDSELIIFPTVFNNDLRIISDFHSISEISVINLQGKYIYNLKNIQNKNLSVDLSFLQQGIYFIEVSLNDNINSDLFRHRHTFKVIKL